MSYYVSPAEVSYQEAHANQTWDARLIAAGSICLAAAYISVVVRFVSRTRGANQIGIDDISILVALFWTTTFTVFILVLTRYGFGHHQLTVSMHKLKIQGQCFVAVLTILPVATFFVKVSVLALYRRIFKTVKWFNYVIWGTFTFSLMMTIANVFGTIFKCIPVGSEMSTKPHHCINQDLMFTIFCFLSTGLDFWILFMPLPLIWKLNASMKRKLQIFSVFSLGLFACAASLVRSIVSLDTNYYDDTYDDASTMIWCIVEINISVVCACALTFRPAFRFFAEKQHYWTDKYRSSSKGLQSSFAKWGGTTADITVTPHGAGSQFSDDNSQFGKEQYPTRGDGSV